MLIPTCMVKLLEFTLVVACLVLHHYSYDLTDVPTLMLCSGTYVGYVIVISGEIIGEMLFAPLDLVQDMYFGLLGIALFSVCGGMVLTARVKGSTFPRTGDHVLAMILGSISATVAIVFFFDLSLAYLDSEEYDDEGQVIPRAMFAAEAVSASADAYVDTWWSAIGAALFAACGGLTLFHWRDIPPCDRKSFAQAAAALAIAVAIIMLLEALVSYCCPPKAESDRCSSMRTKSARTANTNA